MPAPYAELHAHSAFSFLDGASQPGELVDAALRILAVDPGSRVPERRLALTPWEP